MNRGTVTSPERRTGMRAYTSTMSVRRIFVGVLVAVTSSWITRGMNFVAAETDTSLAGAPVAKPVSGDLRATHGHVRYALYFTDSTKRDPTDVVEGLRKQGFSKFKRVVQSSKSADIEMAFSYTGEAKDDLAPPPPEQLKYFGRGLSKSQEQRLQERSPVLAIEFTYPSSCLPACLADISAFMSELQIRLGALLWDRETREMFSEQAWKRDRVDSWQAGLPNVVKQIAIHAYENNGPIRTVTLGMGKFGLPELCVPTSAWTGQKSIGLLVAWLAQTMVERPLGVQNGFVDLRLATLKHPTAKEYLEARLDENATGEARISLVEGKPELGDNENRVLDLTFDGLSGTSLSERQTALLQSTFGYKDGVINTAHTSEVEEASSRARKKLPNLHREFKYGLPAGDYILFKVPFDTHDGNHEYLWVEVQKWSEDGVVVGLVQNKPLKVPELKAGQVVTVKESDVFDFLVQRANGAVEGNETAELLRKESNKEDL